MSFRRQTEHRQLCNHENSHLQKRVGDWSSEELAFWLKKTFPFFGDDMLERYTLRVISNKVTGKLVRNCREPTKLRRLLKHVCGMSDDHAATTMEAMGVPAFMQPSLDVCDQPKPFRAGVFLDARIKRLAPSARNGAGERESVGRMRRKGPRYKYQLKDPSW